MRPGDLPEGQQSTALAALVAQVMHKALDDVDEGWHLSCLEPDADEGSGSCFKGHAARRMLEEDVAPKVVDALAARVRADVAEEIAQAIEARRAGPGWGIWAQSMNSAAQVAREHAVAPAESVVGAPTQPAGPREQVGRCGDAMPSLVDLRPRYFCSLPAGHLGWHRCDEGAEWTHGAPVGALPEDEGTRQEGLINVEE